MSGFLIIDKPSGWTSHDVVAKLRRATKKARVGHAGTLDPMATGVVVVAFGTATRLLEWATADDKRYRAEITLGSETTTYDADGQVTATQAVTVSRVDIEAALETFRGQLDQRPPAYSAVLVGGLRSYDLARRGEAVELPVRQVRVDELTLTNWDRPRLTLEVRCSKGTYVRSIAHDLGRVLGCGAHLSALRRLASGPFELIDALSVEEALVALESGGDALLPPEAAVRHLPSFQLDIAGVDAIVHGRSVPGAGYPEGVAVRAQRPDGRLLAIIERRGDAMWPRKVLE